LALKSLLPNGLLFFEINQYLGKETVELLQNLGFKNCELKKDIYGNDRMIQCSV
jgi:release factor glutamine methyltransferase